MAYQTQEGYYTVGNLGSVMSWYERVVFGVSEAGQRQFRWYLIPILAAVGLSAGYWYKRRQRNALYGCDCE